MELDIKLLEDTINEILPGLTMVVRDVNLSEVCASKYEPGQIIVEHGFTDASRRVMGMITTHRYSILTNHMTDFSEFEHGTNWGIVVAKHGAHFKVMDIYEFGGKTQILLLHLPDDERWKLFQNVHLNIEDDIIEDCRQRFENKCNEEPVPELTTTDWLARCSMPLGMDEEGKLFSLE